jgi:ABC-type lipopolysaccharide export system ATPase subunit
MEEARIVKLLQNFWDFDTFPLVAPPAGYSVCAFTAGVLSRFSNPAIRDQLLRVAHDGAAKIMVFLAGAVIPDPGSEIWAFGRQVTIRTPQDAAAIGISIIYQELSLSSNLSVAENIYLGRELSRGWIVNRSKMVSGSRKVLTRLGSSINASAPVSSLSIAERQLVEIARAVHHNSQPDRFGVL